MSNTKLKLEVAQHAGRQGFKEGWWHASWMLVHQFGCLWTMAPVWESREKPCPIASLAACAVLCTHGFQSAPQSADTQSGDCLPGRVSRLPARHPCGKS